jgi:hypothetical protein
MTYNLEEGLRLANDAESRPGLSPWEQRLAHHLRWACYEAKYLRTLLDEQALKGAKTRIQELERAVVAETEKVREEKDDWKRKAALYAQALRSIKRETRSKVITDIADNALFRDQKKEA